VNANGVGLPTVLVFFSKNALVDHYQASFQQMISNYSRRGSARSSRKKD
jgi:hypothetical protein